MCEKEKPESSAPTESLTTDELPEQSGKEVQARYWESPVPLPPGHKIHERAHIPETPKGEEVPDARPNPFIQIARINATTMSLIENINLWDPNTALCYAALGTNVNNEVGASYTLGGGPRFPTHVVAILTGTQRQVPTFTGTRGPSDNKWGDYLAVRRNYANERLFCATGYTLQSGAGASDATPNLTIFGRSTEV